MRKFELENHLQVRFNHFKLDHSRGGDGQGRERVRKRMRAADEYKAADASPETATRDSVRTEHQFSCFGSFEVAVLRREPCGRAAVA
jgi:hypothetical protein